MTALTTLNIPVFENIVQEARELDGKQVADYKLSRFACHLTVMNGDPKKPHVASGFARTTHFRVRSHNAGSTHCNGMRMALGR